MISRTAPPAAARGFALAETLVALMLLAIGLLGAAGALIRAQVDLRGLAMADAATDLAADLAERLRAASPAEDPERLLPSWQSAVSLGLHLGAGITPARGALDAVVETEGLPASHAIRIEWGDPVLRAPRRLELPVLLARGVEAR